MSELSVVIAAAGAGRKMRNAGSKSLVSLPDGRTVLRRQLDVLRAAFPAADFVVVVGHDAERVVRTLPAGVRVVENELHGDTGVARSLSMGLRATVGGRAVLVYGDMVFGREVADQLNSPSSALILGRAGSPGGPRALTDGRQVLQLGYGLPGRRPWLNLAVLAADELRLFRELASAPEARKRLGHEVLNSVIDRGGGFRAVTAKGAVTEIHCPADGATA